MHAVAHRRSGQHAVHRDPGAGDLMGHAAGHGQLRRLDHPLMDHVRRGLDAGFAADEDHADPSAPYHPRRVVRSLRRFPPSTR